MSGTSFPDNQKVYPVSEGYFPEFSERYIQCLRGMYLSFSNSKFILSNLSMYLFYLVQIGGGCEAALRPFLRSRSHGM